MIFSDYTIKELADRAKVSTATVSRILSGKGSHRPGTVERVRRIAEKMEAESRAREFGISECIGVLMLTYRDCLNSSYNSTLITSIVEGLAAENCTVQLMALPVKRMNLDHIRSLVIEHGIRALIVPEFNGPYSVSNELDRLGIPIVTIGNIELDGDKSEIVCTDNATAGSDAANYLWSCGHRTSASSAWTGATSATGSASRVSAKPSRGSAATPMKSTCANIIISPNHSRRS